MGTQKTGTTSLQTFMHEHAAQLGEEGVLYPRAFRGNRRNHRLNVLKKTSVARAGASDLDAFAENTRDLLHEIRGGAYRAVFLSQENLWPPRDLSGSALLQLCDSLSTQLKCVLVPVICLRRQDEAMRTYRQMKIRKARPIGSENEFVERQLRSARFHYKANIETLLRYFPEVKVIDYDARLPNVVEAYLELLDLPLRKATENKRRLNTSMTAEMCAALTKLPPTVSDTEYRNIARKIRKSDSDTSGSIQHPLDIPLALKDRIMAHHRTTNLWLKDQGYISENSPFFDSAEVKGKCISDADPVVVEAILAGVRVL